MSHPVRQLTRTLDLLDYLAARGEASLDELAGELQVPRASVHRLLVALALRGYVTHFSADSVYRLGPAVRRLAARSVESALVRLASPALVDLRAKTGETVNLAILDVTRIVYAATLDGTRQPRMSASVGAEAEPHATALGKAILSMVDPATRERILQRPPFPAYTPHTITSPAELDAELSRSADRGYAVEVEESSLSATCIAAPILDADGRALAAISISGVSGRLPAESHERLGNELRAWADRIRQEAAAVTTSEGAPA
jgi:IclR family transcriptional regulator, acetate operon repressor